jgi:hypothetical protein
MFAQVEVRKLHRLLLTFWSRSYASSVLETHYWLLQLFFARDPQFDGLIFATSQMRTLLSGDCYGHLVRPSETPTAVIDNANVI